MKIFDKFEFQIMKLFLFGVLLTKVAQGFVLLLTRVIFPRAASQPSLYSKTPLAKRSYENLSLNALSPQENHSVGYRGNLRKLPL